MERLGLPRHEILLQQRKLVRSDGRSLQNKWSPVASACQLVRGHNRCQFWPHITSTARIHGRPAAQGHFERGVHDRHEADEHFVFGRPPGSSFPRARSYHGRAFHTQIWQIWAHTRLGCLAKYASLFFFDNSAKSYNPFNF